MGSAPRSFQSGTRTRTALDLSDLFGLQTLGTFGNQEFYSLALSEGAETVSLNGGVVHEDVTAGRALDESVALRVVEPFHRALFFIHSVLLFLRYLRCLVLLSQPLAINKKSHKITDSVASLQLVTGHKN